MKRITRPRKNAVTFECGGGWGDAINWNEPSMTDVHGWKRNKPQPGDVLLSDMRSGRKGVFIFQSIQNCGDPPDMFFAKVHGVGYTDDADFEIPPVPKGGFFFA